MFISASTTCARAGLEEMPDAIEDKPMKATLFREIDLLKASFAEEIAKGFAGCGAFGSKQVLIDL